MKLIKIGRSLPARTPKLKLKLKLKLQEQRTHILMAIALMLGLNTSILAQNNQEALDRAETYAEGIPAEPIIEPPPAPYPQGLCILINIRDQRCWLYNNGKPIDSSPVSTGKKGKETPQGDFFVINKHKDWISTIYHRPMPYFLRLNPGDFGLHQGVLGDRPLSNGCIRLPEGMAKKFFNMCPIGTKVKIE